MGTGFSGELGRAVLDLVILEVFSSPRNSVVVPGRSREAAKDKILKLWAFVVRHLWSLSSHIAAGSPHGHSLWGRDSQGHLGDTRSVWLR